jgi:hypothetical protein
MRLYQNQINPFIMPVDVSIVIENRSTPFETVIWINESMQLITIEIMKGEVPYLIKLDPHGWVLHSERNLTAIVDVNFSSYRTTQSTNSAATSAFDFGALVLLITIVFPISVRFRRKKDNVQHCNEAPPIMSSS